MSSRTNSDFGTLGERTRRPGTRFVLVDGKAPGVIIEWALKESGWWARVAWVEGRELRVAEVAATRLAPQTIPATPATPPTG